MFAAVLLLIAVTLNIIDGIAAVGNAHFFANTLHVFSSFQARGGSRSSSASSSSPPGSRCLAAEATAGKSGAESIGALESLLSIGGTHPWWSLAIFALCIYILHGLIVFGEEEPTQA